MIKIDEENRGWFRNWLVKICLSSAFILLINTSIIANTICLSLDKYPQDENQDKILNFLNYGFFAIFFVEMCIKIIGMGPKIYIKDYYNIFDAVVGKSF